MIVVFAITALGMLLFIVAGKLVYHIKFEGNALSVLAALLVVGVLVSIKTFLGE